MRYISTILEFNDSKSEPTLVCRICGAKLYRTDIGGNKKTYQCSSDEAKFWEFTRGSKEQLTAHKHFYDSSVNI